MRAQTSGRGWSAVQALAAVLPCIVLVYACARHGLAVDNDTADFFSAADSVIAGEGLIMSTGRLFILWPPLPPLLLAGFALLGVDHVTAFLVINLVALFLTLVVGARLVSRLTGSPGLGLAWPGLVALTPDFFWIHTRALSEPLFMTFCVLAVAGCSQYLERPRRRAFLLMSLGAGLAWVERYAGMILLPVLGTCLMFAPGPATWLERLRRTLGFGVLAGLPMLPYVLRNLVQTGQLTGDRGTFGVHGMPGDEVLANSASTILAWFVPDTGSPVLVALAALALVAIVVGLLRGPAVTAAPTPHRNGRVWPLIGVPLAYVAFTDLINFGYEIDGVGPRQMLPALPFLWMLAVVATGRALDGWRSRRPLAKLTAVVLGTAALGWLAVTVPHAFARVAQWRAVGTGSYSTDWWHSSAILRAARDRPTEPELYSNDTYALYYFTGQRSSPTPPRPWRFGLLARRLQREGRSIQVVWVRTNDRNDLPVERMQEHVRITTLVSERDGEIYRIDPR